MTDGNIDEVQQLPEAIEQQASKIHGMDELGKQSNLIDEQKAKLEDFQDPKKAKQKAVEMIVKNFKQHF